MTTAAKPVPALPGPYSVDAVINRLIAVAGSQEGYREGRTGTDWNNDTAYGAWYGLNGNAWCAMFVSWCAFTAGIPETVIPKHAYTPTGYNWFKAQGETVDTPKRGDIMYVYYASIGRIGHVGIVESVGDGFVRTIEGNTNTNGSSQGDGVYRLKRDITSRLRFVRPNYAACVKPAPKPELISLAAIAYAANGAGYFHIGQAPALADARLFYGWIKRLGIISQHNYDVWDRAIRQGNWSGAQTEFCAAIKRFQSRYGLKADGVVDTATKAKIRQLMTHDNYRIVE